MKRAIFCIIVCLLALVACKKNDIPIDQIGCEILPPSPAFGWIQVYTDTGYSSPCFNPENPDEIIFREHNYSTGEFWLCKLNLQSMEKVYIFQGNFWSSPRWGKDDWIIFTLSDANLYKIKSDGTGLEQLTFEGKSFSPGWSYDYQKIYYKSHIIIPDTTRPGIPPPMQQKSIGISIDLDGNLLDTLWGGWGYGLWPINDSLAASVSMVYPTTGFSLYNFKTGEYEFIYFGDSSSGIRGSGVVQLSSKDYLWASEDGVFITNISTKKTIKIRETCNSNFYAHPTYSAQSNKVILVQIIRTPKGDVLETDGGFVIMNPHGADEIEISMP